MLIKICGITTLEEIDYINELKPDYTGFVFAESKRKVNIENGKELLKALDKDVKSVGVFRNNTKEYIIEVIKNIPLDIIQLHGDEDNDFINYLKDNTNCEIWKAVGIKNKEDLIKAKDFNVETLLLDGSNPGSGELFPWEYLKEIDVNKRFFIAGGINEENVLEAMENVNPYGVDTSSGVETIENGIRRKDKEKIKRLIKKVRDY
ncbi:MAG: phosphoribosylanthranilate isomerase [Clostridium sp.]|jgi:phosphoribosylanthranilate isomerase|nr:phosphoribosylanthranilate isomerase [Clostridium sp.]